MAYKQGRELDASDKQEAKGKAVFVSWLERKGASATEAGLQQQLAGIDFLVSLPDGRKTTIELKSDGTNHTGTIFAEEWADTRRNKTGWLMTTTAEHLVYVWTRTDQAVSFSPKELKEAIYEGGLCKKLQTVTKKTWQCTTGFRVPISELEKLESFKKLSFNG